MSRNGSERAVVAHPEVVSVEEQRWGTAEEDLRILYEADACRELSEVDGLARREWICSSALSDWLR